MHYGARGGRRRQDAGRTDARYATRRAYSSPDTRDANLPVPGELKSKINALGPSTGAGVGDHGCADASLYARLTKVGLTPSMLGPQFAIYRDGERLADVLDRLIGVLSESDGQLCREAVQQAKMNGTLFVAEPFHCAIVRKSTSERER